MYLLRIIPFAMGARQVSLLLTKINLSNLFILFLPKTDDLVARRLHQAVHDGLAHSRCVEGFRIDPVYLQLPNSGILIQYTVPFGLNPDGSSNEEMGTTPNLVSPAEEPPLITALRAIGEA